MSWRISPIPTPTAWSSRPLSTVRIGGAAIRPSPFSVTARFSVRSDATCPPSFGRRWRMVAVSVSLRQSGSTRFSGTFGKPLALRNPLRRARPLPDGIPSILRAFLPLPGLGRCAGSWAASGSTFDFHLTVRAFGTPGGCWRTRTAIGSFPGSAVTVASVVVFSSPLVSHQRAPSRRSHVIAAVIWRG